MGPDPNQRVLTLGASYCEFDDASNPSLALIVAQTHYLDLTIVHARTGRSQTWLICHVLHNLRLIKIMKILLCEMRAFLKFMPVVNCYPPLTTTYKFLFAQDL